LRHGGGAEVCGVRGPFAKPHVTKDRYIKVFEPAVLDAMQQMQAKLDGLRKWPAAGQQLN
jgi:hypothetical protein